MSAKPVWRQTEEAVEKALKRYLDVPIFDFQRLPDSKAARNYMVAQISDFLYYLGSSHGVIEVKSVKHDYRLPRSNFGDTQFSLLNRRSEVTDHIYIIVYHTSSDVWRVVNFKKFSEQLGDKASVDLRDSFGGDDCIFGSAAQCVGEILNRTSA